MAQLVLAPKPLTRPGTIPRRLPRLFKGRVIPLASVWVFFLANLVAIALLWYGDGGTSAVHDLGTLLTSVGRLTGLLAAYLILVQVVLLARLPFLERAVGLDRLSIWHARNGKLSILLVIAHVVTITPGYALVDQISLPAEISQFLRFYPWMIAACIGTALLVAVVLLSLAVLRGRLPYEAWYAVHLTVYLGIALAWFHQIPTGWDLVTNALAARYWTSLYLGTLVVLIAFRLLRPVLSAARFRLRVEAVVSEGPDVVSIWMSGRSLGRLHARSGQFMLFRFLTPSRALQSHPFSLSALPVGDRLRITVKAAGTFTRNLAGVRPGTMVLAEGPFGVFGQTARPGRKSLLIAGGIGITPIRTLMEDMPGDLTVLYRARKNEDFVLREELDALAAHRGIRLLYVTDGEGGLDSHARLSPAHLRQFVPDLADREVYLCGPPAMTEMIARSLKAGGATRMPIHVERFAL